MKLTLILILAWAVRPITTNSLPLEPTLPRVEKTRPLGVRRGVATEVTIRGSALVGNAKLVVPFKFAIEALESGKLDPATFKARITADPKTPLGVYPARILTDEGLSEPFPLAVGQLPQILEKGPIDNPEWMDEPNRFAHRIKVPAVVEFHCAAFRFRGERGQRIFAQAQSSVIGSAGDLSSLLVSVDREFNRSAYERDGDPADPPLLATLPTDGDYLLIMKTVQRPIEGGRRSYRLTVGALPAAAEVYPMGGRRGETVRVELSGGTLDNPMRMSTTLSPAPGESIVRLLAQTTIRGPGGSPLDVEGLPPLIVGDLPEVLEPTDPDAPPPKVSPPVVLNGRIEKSAWKPRHPEIDNRPEVPGDEDRFTLVVAQGQRLRIQVASRALGSALHPLMKVQDFHGKELALISPLAAYQRVDEPHKAQFVVPARGDLSEYVTYDPTVEFTVPDGQTEVTLTMSGMWSDKKPSPSRSGTYDYGGSGHAYRVTVLPITPSFSITLDDAQVSVPRGGIAAVGVTVDRDGYDGPISLRVPDAPAGLSVRPGAIAAGKNAGIFTLESADDASFGPLVLDVIGEGRSAEGPITVHASKAILFGPATTEPYRVQADTNFFIHYPAYLRTRVPIQPGLFAVATKAAALRLDAPAGPIDVHQGSGTAFNVTVRRPAGATGELTLRPLKLPPGLSTPEVEIGEAGTEATIKVEVARDSPLGATSVVLSAQGKIGGTERTFIVPAVTLQVVDGAKDK